MANNRPGSGSQFAKKVEKPKNVKKVLSRLMKYIASSKGFFIGLMIAAILLTITNLAANVLIKNVVGALGTYDPDWVEHGLDHGWTVLPVAAAFKNAMIMVLVIYLLHCIFQYLSSLFSAYVSVRTVRNMRNDLFAKIVRLPIRYVDTHAHGDIMSRMTNDVDNISNTISSSITSLISGLLTIIGCLGIMIYYSPLLTLVALITIFLTLLLTGIMSKFMRPLFVKQQSLLGDLNTQTEEMVSGCKTVMAYNHQEAAEQEFNHYSDHLCKVSVKAQILSGSFGPMMNFIGNVGYFLVCFFGAFFILKGWGNTLLGAPLTISIVIMFTNTIKQFNRPINEIAQLYSQILTAMAGAERVFAILDEESEDFSKKIDFDPEKVDGTIDFEHINFSYVPGKPVLKDFSIDVYKGHKIALVGATGSGKTTIVNLLMRFYDVDSGTIKIDGTDIHDISKKDLRDCISIVLQDAVLFSDSIANNVRYGKEDATDAELDEALKMANCYSFVKKLPDQEQTILTEGGANLSQGQRQLLTIARAILANPKILILDEATSSVDTRTEKKIQDAMIKLMENRTSIIIAHRLSTIQDADLIVVLDQGHVVEMGNHEELLKQNGVYNKLYQTQFSGLNT